jgi:hypothetical protein
MLSKQKGQELHISRFADIMNNDIKQKGKVNEVWVEYCGKG